MLSLPNAPTAIRDRAVSVSTGTEPMSADPLTALNNEYGGEWTVRHPDRYVADHRRLDVRLISDSVPELKAGRVH